MSPSTEPGSSLRPGTARDTDALAALEQDLFGTDAWSTALVADTLSQPHSHVLVAVDGEDECDTVIGYAITSLAGDITDLLRIGVAGHVRRRGVARHLLDRAVGEARLGGADRMLLEVSHTNTGALAFYDRAGFTRISRRRRYYADGSDALVLQLKVDEGCTWPAPHPLRADEEPTA